MVTRQRSNPTRAPRKATGRKAAPRGAAAKKAAPKSAVPSTKADKTGAPKAKHKLVRDSFTIPKNEYAMLAALKERATQLARPAKKSEILRAGVALLGTLNDAAFLAAVGAVPSLKTGRPGKKNKA